jgi:hypothetical protein
MWSERLNCILYYGLTLCWCFFYAGVMRTELGVNIELRGVSSCDVRQGLQWVKVFDQYILLLEDTYEEWFPAVRFYSLIDCLNNSTVLSTFPYSCLLFKIWNEYAEIWLFVLMYLVCSRCRTPVDLPAWPTYELLQVLHFSWHMQLEFILFCCTLLQIFLYTILVVKNLFSSWCI